MSDLEEKILADHERIKVNTLKAIRMRKPIQFMINVAKVGEKYYHVPANLSFHHGLEESFVKYGTYNKPKSMADMFYSIKHGTEEILRYCYNNYYLYNEEE